MSTLPTLPSLASAIANAEGYGVAGAIPTLANNPGDLVLGNQGNGTLGSGITVFGSVQEGWDALTNQLTKIASGASANYSPDESISQIGETWAGGGSWASNVATFLGVTPSSTFASVFGGGTSSPSTSTSSAVSSALAGTLPRLAAGIVGLVLISAGVFSFDKARETIVTGAKTAAELAA
jgi:hypothetical protein